jgi:chaperonin GroEL
MEGFRFDSGYVSPSFINIERKRSVVYEDPFILVVDDKIDKVDDILHILEIVARESKPLVIIASDVEGQALAALIMNTVRGTMKIAAVKAPRYGEERRGILKDLCVATGSSFVTKSGNLKIKDVKLENLGSCKKIEIIKGFTTIVGGDSDPDEVEKKIEDLKEELETTENIYAAERIQERITRLASGVAIIRVGAATEAEMIEKHHRVEDALEAVKAAQKEGIVPGGGVALLKALEGFECETDSPDQLAGAQCVLSAAKAPIRQMATNAGVSPDIIEKTVLAEDGDIGYNFVTDEVCDMFEQGIIDPLLVTKTALQNAASAAGILITSGYAIIQEEK